MPNIKSAFKRMRQNAERNQRNRARKAAMKTVEKSFRAQIEQNDLTAAKGLLTKLSSMFDKAAKIGTISKNRTNRKKSRLTLLLNAKSKS